MPKPWSIGMALSLTAASVTGAPYPVEIEARLPELTGIERARALAELTDAYRGEDPDKAIAYGEEALEILAASPEPRTTVATLNELAWAYMARGERQRATELAERGRDLARENGLSEGEARAANNLGVIARRWGEPLEAIRLFNEALEIYRRTNARADVAMSLNNLGVVYSFDLADYSEALEYQLEALAIRRSLEDREGLSLSYNNLGVIYQRLGQIPEAREHYLEALALRRELGMQHRIAGTLHNLGDLALDEGQLEEAVAFHEEALQIRTEIGERSSQPMSLRSLALAYGRLGRIGLAERHARRAVELSESIEGPKETALSLLGLAEVLRRRERLDEAVDAARRGLALAEASAAKDAVRRAARDLAALEEQSGHYREALVALQRFTQADDDIFDEDRTRRLEILESRYQAERREREIERLRTEQAVQALEIERQRRQRTALLAGLGTLGLLGLALYSRHREISRFARALGEANRQLEDLSVTDSLSGLRNRRYLSETIGTDLAASRRGHREAAERGQPASGCDVTFLLLDVDHFKEVNDTLGHEAGDEVIRQIAARLRGTCRGSDVIVRWGGEEFLVLNRGTDRDEAAGLAERIRTAVEEMEIDVGAATVRRTLSIGYASYPFVPSHPDAMGWEQVVALADEAMYQAKRSGRNGWVGVESAGCDEHAAKVDPSSWDLEEMVAAGKLRIRRSARPGGPSNAVPSAATWPRP